MIKLSQAPRVESVVKAAFPDYRKRTAVVLDARSVTLMGTWWQDGSRSTYAAVDLSTNKVRMFPQLAPPQFGGPAELPEWNLQPGNVVVRAGTFWGRPAQAVVYVLPEDRHKLLLP